ncbi:TetR family transcriptional regulator [Stackebrandtia albiflava]|uniref:TetR family transcriptional regulator n=1 Tax=Stackebrandtia albiflava TaxID=406432 RepID=A0A562V2T8_9ACTN|nr:TetR/AcrR family transcriptional regulator [Stackebrandtia albiflava]TWJ12206.1 TetR family transcriptional regulator [Stackebrandtia albiflava]
MARPRTFDETTAVDAAMRVFWRAGYDASTTEELCDATGLRRSSIYNTFRSKRDLFLRALTHYTASKNRTTAEVLERDAPLRDRLRDLLDRIAEPDAADPVGCLVVRASVELAPRDAEVAAVLERDRRERFAMLRDAFLAARGAGELPGDLDPSDAAHFVIATISGMQVAAAAGAGPEVLRGIAGSASRVF